MIPRTLIGERLAVSRIIKGGWHLAGGHGPVDRTAAKRDMARFVDAGISSFDCADIYTGVEELIGEFKREYPSQARELRVHTKFVPDLERLAGVDRDGVEAVIDRSCARLRCEQLDTLFFNVVSGDNGNWSTPWIIDDPMLYVGSHSGSRASIPTAKRPGAIAPQ